MVVEPQTDQFSPSHDMDWLKLTGPQRGKLVDILVKAFGSIDQFKLRLERSPVNRLLAEIVVPDKLPVFFLEVVKCAAKEGWLQELRNMVHDEAPKRVHWIREFDKVLSDATRAGRSAEPRNSGRPLPLAILYCHIFREGGQNDAHGGASVEKRVDELFRRLEKFVTDRERGSIAWRQNEGFLATFASPSVAAEVALAMQRAADKIAGEFDCFTTIHIGIAIGLCMLPPGRTVGPTNSHAASICSIAELADHGQVLMTTAVADTVRGATLNIPSDRLKWARHGDYVLRRGEVRELHEVADAEVRKTQAPKATATLNPGQGQLKFAGFTDLERLTPSGVTVVYKARQVADNSLVAIKVLLGELGSNAALNQAFLQPPRVLKTLDHAGLVKIREVSDEGLPYFVMDWIEGTDFTFAASECDEDDDKLEMAIKVCEALGEAHKKDLVHGDLKPSNIIVRMQDRQPILLDFGQHDWEQTNATDSSNQRQLGTPLYVAPELIVEPEPFDAAADPPAEAGQAADRQVTATVASDIYSLGIILYESFVGHPPFEFTNRQLVLDAHVNSDPPLPRIEIPTFNPDLEAVILKAIEKQPAERYQSAGELAADLKKVRNRQRVDARPRVYDNMMETRAHSTMRQVESWRARGHITPLEYDSIRRAFDSLLRTGLAAVGESRLTHLPIVLLYLFGVMLVSGLSVFLVNHADFSLRGYPLARIAIGLSIPVAAALLWKKMRDAGRYRAAFAIGVISVTSLPLAITNTLYELTPESYSYSICHHSKGAFFGGSAQCFNFEHGLSQVEATEAVQSDATASDGNVPVNKIMKYTNWQIFLGLLSALIWARVLANRTGTVTLATMSAILLAITYLGAMDFVGWRYFVASDEHYYRIGVWLLPFTLIALSCFGSDLFARPFKRWKYAYLPKLAKEQEKQRHVLPFVNAGSIFLIFSLTIISATYAWGMQGELWLEIPDVIVYSGLLLCAAGLVLYIAAQSIGKWYFSDAVFARWMLFYIGALYTVGGLLIADFFTQHQTDKWLPQQDPDVAYSATIAVPVALSVAVFIVLESVRLNSRSVMATGLALVAFILMYIEFRFVESYWWAVWLVACGSIALGATCWMLRRPEERPDIDDVGEELVRKARQT